MTRMVMTAEAHGDAVVEFWHVATAQAMLHYAEQTITTAQAIP